MTTEDLITQIELRLISLGATQRELTALEDCTAVRVIEKFMERVDLPEPIRVDLTRSLNQLHEAIAVDWVGG